MFRVRSIVKWCLIAAGHLLCLASTVWAGDIVPFETEYCGIRLKFTVEGRNAVQREVDLIRENPAAFNKMTDKAAAYFPHIRDAFRKIGVPEDLMYIAIQESGLRGDAVSKSNAVGFWQFKESTAKMVGLTVNNFIDERKHIFKSSVGAARYFATNYFRHGNWLFSVISYYEGGTGALNHIDLDRAEDTEMVIDETLHHYARKAIAHKIAYHDEIPTAFPPKMWLEPFSAAGGTMVADLLETSGTDESVFKKYNLWVKSDRLPADGDYSYYVPRFSAAKYAHVPDPYLHLYAQEVFPAKKQLTASAQAGTAKPEPAKPSNVYKPAPAPPTTAEKRTEKVVFRSAGEPEQVENKHTNKSSIDDKPEIAVQEQFRENQTVSSEAAPAEKDSFIYIGGKKVRVKTEPSASQTRPSVPENPPAKPIVNNDNNGSSTENSGYQMVGGVKMAVKPSEKKPSSGSPAPKLAPKNVHPSQGFVMPKMALKPSERYEGQDVNDPGSYVPKPQVRPDSLTEAEELAAEADAEAQGKTYFRKKYFKIFPITEDNYYNREYVVLTPTFGIVDAASKFDLPLRTLCQYNSIKLGQLPPPGTVLYIFSPAQRHVYIPTADNETIEEIAMKHGKEFDFLRNLNEMKADEHFVKKGQKVYLRYAKPEDEPWTLLTINVSETQNPVTVTQPVPTDNPPVPKVSAAVQPAESVATQTLNYLTHTVEAFDTLESVADRYETTPEKVRDLNKRTLDELKIGEVIRVKILE